MSPATGQADTNHSSVPALVTGTMTAIFAVIMGLLFLFEIPDANREVAYMLIGQGSALWGATVTYWVGTTRSSAEKSRLMVK